MTNIDICYIFCPIQEKYISRALYTLYKYSKPDSFRVIVIDQTKHGFSDEVRKYVTPLIHLYMHPYRNLGYAKAMNEGLIHALHWKTPLICPSNDDIEIIDPRWLDGIKETFALRPKIGCVVPMSPRVAGWGYGVPGYPEVLPYKEEYSKEDYDYLLKGNFSNKDAILPKTMPRTIGNTVVDGAVFTMPYFSRKCLQDVGLMDEHFYPGSGEDTDWNARAYQKGWRVLSTSKSWIWHWWSKSKDLFASGELEDSYYKPKDHPYWNNHSDLWPEGFDIWGRKDGKILPRKKEVFVDQI